jgi:hypothetical protein
LPSARGFKFRSAHVTSSAERMRPRASGAPFRPRPSVLPLGNT